MHKRESCSKLVFLHLCYRLAMEEPIKIAGVERTHVEKKPKRKRQKKLCSQIREQVNRKLF